MSRTSLPALTRTLVVATVLAAPVLLVASPASATALVNKAQLSGSSLLIEGTAYWDRTITVDGVAMTTSDAGGRYKISRSGYTPPADCTVDVADGIGRPTTVRLGGCTVTAAPAPAMLPDSAELGPFPLGAPVPTTVVSVPGAVGPVAWQITAGALPAGLSLDVPTPTKLPRPNPPEQLTFAQILGTPTAQGTGTVTLRATDTNGLTVTRTYTVRVTAAPTVSITPEPWPPATVGSFTNLWIDGAGGLKPYRWTVVGGALPTGMTLIQDVLSGPSVRVGGTPTTAGTYDWVLQLTDAQGATVTRAFSATVATAP
jgi:Putative Ig domain